MPKKNQHNLTVGSEIERSNDRIDETAEVFTPMEMCVEMVNEIPAQQLQDPNSTFIDPAAGNGNFMIALKQKLIEYHTENHVLNHMLYAVELMQDNHREMCERLGVSTDHPHYVCADALAYDYSFGEPVGLEAFM